MNIGQVVVFEQADVEAPVTVRNLRRHPAIVASVSPSGDVLDLIVLPFGNYGMVIYKEKVRRCGEREGGGWLPVED